MTYNKPTPEIVRSVRFSLSTTGGAYDKGKAKTSVQGTRWFVAIEPDYMKPEPWNTTIIVGDRSSNQPFLRVDVLGHGNSFTADWLNEKLIYLEVWWGRIYASDIIVDVEKRQIIYHELAYYGQVTFCKEQ